MLKNFLCATVFCVCSFCTCAQNRPDQSSLPLDSINGFNGIALGSSYKAMSDRLIQRETIGKHQRFCVVNDSSLLKLNQFNLQSFQLEFINDQLRTIYINIQDSINVSGVLLELKKRLGNNNFTQDNDRNTWFGNNVTLNYTVDAGNRWGVISIRSQQMECFASKVLKNKYRDDDESGSGIHCPRIDPCDK